MNLGGEVFDVSWTLEDKVLVHSTIPGLALPLLVPVWVWNNLRRPLDKLALLLALLGDLGSDA